MISAPTFRNTAISDSVRNNPDKRFMELAFNRCKAVKTQGNRGPGMI